MSGYDGPEEDEPSRGDRTHCLIDIPANLRDVGGNRGVPRPDREPGGEDVIPGKAGARADENALVRTFERDQPAEAKAFCPIGGELDAVARFESSHLGFVRRHLP